MRARSGRLSAYSSKNSAHAQDSRELADFRGEIEGISEAHENILTLAGSAAEAVESYNRRISSRIGRQSSEFQAIVKMLRNSLATVAGENSGSIQRLARIGGELERGTCMKDVQSLRLHLDKCLSGVREQIERAKGTSKSTLTLEPGAAEKQIQAFIASRYCRNFAQESTP
jgi:hypothetical protein